MVSRLGCDGFQFILPDQGARGKLGDLARDIIASLSQPYSVEGSRCIIGASVGVAIAPFDGMTSDDLVRNADLALYAAKGRSEEHTSELQSLMRISYAVFCLKKKTNTKQLSDTIHNNKDTTTK